MVFLKPPSRQKRDLPRQQLTRIFPFFLNLGHHMYAVWRPAFLETKGALIREESRSASDARKNVGSSIQGLGKAYDHFLMT